MCDSCNAAMINGVYCHEIGCPESWKDADGLGRPRECKWCGRTFRPESPHQECCDDSCCAAYNGWPDPNEPEEEEPEEEDEMEEDERDIEEQLLDIKGVEPWHAYVLACLIENVLEPDEFPSAKAWIKQCYNKPWTEELVMCAANEIIGGHGVESIGINGEWDYGKASFVNLGDTYDTTLLYDHEEEEYMVCSWGSWVEEKEVEAASEVDDD